MITDSDITVLPELAHCTIAGKMFRDYSAAGFLLQRAYINAFETV